MSAATWGTRRELRRESRRHAARQYAAGNALLARWSLLDPPPRLTIPKDGGIDELANRRSVEMIVAESVSPPSSLTLHARLYRWCSYTSPFGYDPNLPAWW